MVHATHSVQNDYVSQLVASFVHIFDIGCSAYLKSFCSFCFACSWQKVVSNKCEQNKVEKKKQK